MVIEPQPPANVELFIAPGTAPMFATVLQAGARIAARPNETLGAFLNRLPGFTQEYIVNEIQTIFLNGTAIDNLESPLTGDNPTLALSAAMPGLAGAIFRKNSFHAALRTTVCEHHSSSAASATVTLKLFNSIARDRGPALLREGVAINANSLLTFFEINPTLSGHIRRGRLDSRDGNYNDLTEFLARTSDIRLTVREVDHD
jgi:hypothetical protein